MANIKLGIKYSGIDTKNIIKYSEEVEEIDNELRKNSSKEGEFLGWITWPEKYDKSANIVLSAEGKKELAKVLLDLAKDE